MNIDTGEIREFRSGEAIPAGFIPLTAREVNVLRGRKAKDRIAALKLMRRRAIALAKKAKGERLTEAEMEAVLKPIRELVPA